MADENKKQTTYTLYEDSYGRRYILDDVTGKMYKVASIKPNEPDPLHIRISNPREQLSNEEIANIKSNAKEMYKGVPQLIAYDYLKGSYEYGRSAKRQSKFEPYVAKNGKLYYRNEGSEQEYKTTIGTDTYTFTLPGELMGGGFNKSVQSKLVDETKKNGKPLTDKELERYTGIKQGTDRFERLQGWYAQLVDNNRHLFKFDTAGAVDVDPETGEVIEIKDKDGNRVSVDDYKSGNYIPEGYNGTAAQNSQQSAFDRYWRDTYGYNTPGTTAKDFYDQFVASERSAGQSAINLANAQTQQLGLQQAAYVKNVTDQLKSERMARLRAGMSESQIASQDMQQLYANMNSLNDQIVASNMAALQGQEQINNAQSTAFQNWIANANQMAQSGSAYSAAQAGDISAQAKQYLDNLRLPYTPSNWNKAYEAVSRGANTTNPYTTNKQS